MSDGLAQPLHHVCAPPLEHRHEAPELESQNSEYAEECRNMAKRAEKLEAFTLWLS